MHRCQGTLTVTGNPRNSKHQNILIIQTIADALINGEGIEMAGCTKAAEGRCPKCPLDACGQE